MAKPNVKDKSKQVITAAREKTRSGFDKAYEAKRPFAIAAIAEFRETNPKATPTQIQDLLDQQLMRAESRFSPISAKFSAAATLYVNSSVELRGLDIKSTSGHQKLVDLMVVLDSAGIKYFRWAVNIAAFVLPFMKGAKAVKIAGVAVAAMGAGKIANKVQSKYSVADFLITKTNSTLGPVPRKWADEQVEEEKPKRKGLRRLWK
jgi:hypothetical protein